MKEVYSRNSWELLNELVNNGSRKAILKSILNNSNSKIIKLKDGGSKLFAFDGKGSHYNDQEF